MKFGRSLLVLDLRYTIKVVVDRIWVIHINQWINPSEPYTLVSGQENFNSRWAVRWEDPSIVESIEDVLTTGTILQIIVNGTDLVSRPMRLWTTQSNIRTIEVLFGNLRAGSTVMPYRVISPDGVIRWSNPAVMQQ